MAVDTQQKRMDVLTLASPVPMLLPIPDGTIGDDDRQSLAWLYAALIIVHSDAPSCRTFTPALESRTYTLEC